MKRNIPIPKLDYDLLQPSASYKISSINSKRCPKISDSFILQNLPFETRRLYLFRYNSHSYVTGIRNHFCYSVKYETVKAP